MRRLRTDSFIALQLSLAWNCFVVVFVKIAYVSWRIYAVLNSLVSCVEVHIGFMNNLTEIERRKVLNWHV